MATAAVISDSQQHPHHAPDLAGLTFRAVVIGLAFTLLFNVIVRKVELVTLSAGQGTLEDVILHLTAARSRR